MLEESTETMTAAKRRSQRTIACLHLPFSSTKSQVLYKPATCISLVSLQTEALECRKSGAWPLSISGVCTAFGEGEREGGEILKITELFP